MTIGWCRWVAALLSAAAIHVGRTRAGAPWELGAERRAASAHKDGRDWPRVIFPLLALNDRRATNCERVERPHMEQAFAWALGPTRAGHVRPTLHIDLVQDPRAIISLVTVYPC